MVELLDGPHGAVGDVQRPVALTKLDAVPHGKTALLHALHFKGPALLGVDDTGQAAALELEPEEVSPLVETDDPRALACLDTATPSHEAQHVAHAVAFRASPLLGGEILPHHHRRLDALPLHSASFDERFPDAPVEVGPFGVARRDDYAAATVCDEVARDCLVALPRIGNLHHAASELEELHSAARAAGFGGGQDRLAEPLVFLPADHVEPLGCDPRPVDQERKG